MKKDPSTTTVANIWSRLTTLPSTRLCILAVHRLGSCSTTLISQLSTAYFLSIVKHTNEKIRNTSSALIKQLQLNAAKCDSIIAQGNSERIKRQQDALKQLAVVVDNRRRQMEHNKIAANEDLTDVMAWSEKVEEIARADVQIELLAKHMRENKRKAEAEERNSVLAFEKAQGEQSLTNKARFGPKLYKASLPNQRHQLHQHHNKRQKPNCPKSR